MRKSLIIAGAGGQGNLFGGMVLSTAALIENLYTTWVPSYGPAMRGGKSTCTVVISDKEIGSPIIKYPDAFIIMNRPSLDFLEGVRPETRVIINESLANFQSSKQQQNEMIFSKENYELIYSDSILERMGSKELNMLLLGDYLKGHFLKLSSIEMALEEILTEKGKMKFFEQDKLVLTAGYNLKAKIEN